MAQSRPSVLVRLARVTVRRRRLILVGAVIAFAVSGALGGGVASKLSSGGFDDPGAESTKAQQYLDTHFKQAGMPNVVLLVTADPGRTVDSPDVVATGQALTAELAHEHGITFAASYWSTDDAPPLKTADGRRALVFARYDGNSDQVNKAMNVLGPKYTRSGNGVTVGVSGFGEIFREVGTTIEHDLVRAEMIALPITLVLLLLVFGSGVSALLPLAIGALSIVGTFLVLLVINTFTEVSVFSLNLTTGMGLGLAIDYSLFIVSRYREELRAGFEPHVAVERTVATAGRTVGFSALTVAASLCALLVFPLAFLKSFAYAGIAVAALAGVYAVIVLPAMLAALGRRVDALTLRRHSIHPPEEGFWHNAAVRVMRRPIPFATGAVLLLLFLGSPALRMQLGLPDDRVLPPDKPARQVADVIRKEFNSQEAGALSVVAPGLDAPAHIAEIDAYAVQLAALPGVSRVDTSTGSYLHNGPAIPADPSSPLYTRFTGTAGTFLNVVPTVEPLSAQGEQLVANVRALHPPFKVEVAGMSAQLVDSKAGLLSKLPIALLIIAAITFVLMFLMFGSVVVPAKAVVLNLLSLTATFGAMVWIFQEGHLSGPLGFTPTGFLDSTTPILMFCVAFGMSMDYEVFLLSRIKEEHDRTGDNVRSVAVGLERTGRIVTAAAVLMAVVFLSFATSQVSFIKLFGIGLALAVLMDAFVIRGFLVPAFMRLAGEINWWAPTFLRRVHDRIGIREHLELPPLVLPDPPAEPGVPTLVNGRPRRDRPLVAAGREKINA
ncbi:MAG TPA: MMPL family transporter [Acidimicrobiales bacterium]|jgi:RND superfamily putative drug exporter|nr:MMPL family transporter [Acidimicrobiales bacterium]